MGLFTMTSRAETPAATLEQLMTSDRPAAADRFTDAFLAAMAPTDLARLLADLRAQHGPLQRVETEPDGKLVLHLERAAIPTSLTLDADGRIAGLWFGVPVIAGDIADHAATIRALPGKTALLVLSDGAPVVADNADTPLAVGSAAKLAILAALDEAVTAGRLDWDRVVPLDPRWKSPPSGQLQDWPDGTPLTVATLANLMISISDNTATDGLIALVGRESVEAVTPANAPFPTTREMFTLKTDATAALRDEWVSADAEGRRAILKQIAGMPYPTQLSQDVTHEVEWFMTARELCTLLDRTAALPAVAINPGVTDRASWQAIAFKGGSETGVLNLSTRVTGRDGRVHCIVASWNHDRPLDHQKLIVPYRSILARLATQDRG